jgi:SAM-dependent methyltransferase
VPHCVICDQDVDRWLPHPHREQRSAFMQSMRTVGSDLAVYQCPACGCTDRDRHLWLYLRAAGVLQAVAGACVLHLAPEPVLERLIAALGPARYVRGDLHPARAGHLKLDVEQLPFADGEFDLIICNHVLEHVAAPQRALAELHRCLTPAGLLIAQTPYSSRLKCTFEVDGAITPEFAREFYGQEDHVRLFGADIASHFRAAGFDGQLLQHDAVLPHVSAADWGCNAEEPLFAFWKPGPPAVHGAAGGAA